MRKAIPLALALASAALVAIAASLPAPAAEPPPEPLKPPKEVREILVPFEDLNVLLEGDTKRVLLPRDQYEALLAKAKKEAQSRAPREALLVSADYAAKVGDERAEISGTLVVSVLEDGLHAVGLEVARVGLRGATLDGRSAAIGLADDGRLTLFVEGKGEHTLVLDMVAPLETTAARQILNFRLPAPAAARLSLTIPGDVEVKSGAPVVTRVFDAKTEITRIELLPQRGDTSLVMSLNSRLLRRDRIVVARSVMLDEVTAGYERLHATVSLAILHRAVGSFRFAVPAGFDVTDVRSPNLSVWAIVKEGDRTILDVQLREETTETVVVNLSAVRTAPDLAAWSLARFEPLDVVGHVAVVGLAVEDRLKAEAVTPEGLIPIDNSVLAQALPATVLEAQPGAARIRPVVAYYAPQGAFGLTARFVKPPAALRVTTNLLAVLEDGGLTVHGGFALAPEEEKLFAFDFSAPAGWDVIKVTAADGSPVAFERYGAAAEAGRIHVRLPSGVPAGGMQQVYFTAVHVPKGWFGDWERTSADFPVFAVVGASRDVGAVAVDARDDMTARPETLERLTPLDENEKARYGLQGAAASLAYRYEAQPYRARLAVERTRPRITAQTFSFFRVDRDALVAHYEIEFDVAQARTRRLALVLPADTPTALSIRGLGGAALKEYTSEPVGEKGERRRWTALLAERRSGPVRLAIDFEQRLATLEPAALALPVVEADGVAYQSGLVAVEGSPELDVRVTAHPRKVDIGELVDAEYQPGRRLLGAFGFVGQPAEVKVSVARHPALGLPPAVVQRAELATVLSADRVAQTAARFLLRTKALFLEVRLPEGSTLWSATLDGEPVKPQREAGSMLLNLPAAAEGAVRDLQVVYETAAGSLGFWRTVDVVAPRLYLHAGPETGAEEVPVADLLWHLYMPTGYQVVRSKGSVVTQEVAPPALAVASVAGALYYGGGGVDFDHGAIGLLTWPLRSMGGMSAPRSVVLSKDENGRGEFYYEPAPGDESFESAEMDGAKAEEEQLEMRGADRERAAGPRRPAPGSEAKPLLGLLSDAPAKDAAPEEKPAPTTTAPAKTPSAEPPTTPPPPAAPGLVAAGTVTTLSVAQPKAEPEAKKKEALRKAWALEGLSSLKIDLVRTGHGVTFRSLGTEPRLELGVVEVSRVDALAWGLALAVIVVGLALTTQPAGRKVAYIVGVTLVATLVPVITGRIELAMVVNGSFYAACLLIPYYLVAWPVRWLAAKVRQAFAPPAMAAGLIVLAVAGVLLAGGGPAFAEDKGAPYVIQVVPPPAPVKVPADAIILPYDPASKTGIKDADRLLVPYDKFVELWNQAYPDKPIGAKPPPAPYALAGASLAATLAGDEYLLVEGQIEIDVFTDQYAIVPLPLDGGVLAKADLDGKPARLSVAAVDPKSKDAKAAPQASFIVLYASGKGRHKLDVAVRMRLQRRGGWRVTEGRLPAAPATSLVLCVPEAATEVRLGGVPDRPAYETKAAGETIRTALGADGALSIQWRPKVGEGQIDQTLTADSSAVLDVQEDSLRLVWSLHLEFRRGERDFFAVEVPPEYTVEKVEGTNVRGWELKAAGARQELTVTLLKPAKGTEDFTVSIWRQTDKAAPPEGLAFDAPLIGVAGALRHTGQLVIRRSPLLDLRMVSTSATTRADLPAEPDTNKPGGRGIESPLGIRPFQAYRFAATPFVVRLEARPVAVRTTAVVQTILRVAERERSLEARAVLNVENRPLYRARIVVPNDLKLDRVVAPGTFEWALTQEGERKVLTVYLAGGVQGGAPIVIQGKLGEDQKALEAALPHLEVLDVAEQKGDIVVQVDPAFDVRAEGLTGIEAVLLQSVGGWLSDGQKALAGLALHYKGPGYAGRLVLTARKPDVTCFTVTNARVTDRAVEETILVDWTVRGAGIREVSLVLPSWMKDARISVPLLRQKTITPVKADDPASPLRVRLELQDEVMDQLRVLVENDRLLSEGVLDAPIPVVETGRTDRRYVALESAGRDEVVVEKQDGLEPLSRQQKEWEAVSGLLRGGMTQAFIVSAGAEKPRLAFRTKQRAAIETAGARIGLAQTVLVLDSSGAYRAEQVYRLDNRTEQFLEIQMPEGAGLWTAVVAGEPVKPTLMDDVGQAGRVRIPLVKTAEGDLDYAVVLKYGGTLGSLENLRLGVRFPIIRAVNINAELSQVELHLPETHVWFDFRGTMSRAVEKGTFEAGILGYQAKLADRLVQTLRSDNPFAQTRAKSNLANIGQSIRQFQSSLGDGYGNKMLEAELSNAGVVLQNAEKEVQAQEKAAETTADLNNDLIRRSYASQRNRRARNLVQDLGSNWKDAATVQPAPQGDQARFNDAWLSDTQLENKAGQAKQAEAGARFRAQRQDGQAPQQGDQPAADAKAGTMFGKFAGGKGDEARKKDVEGADTAQRRRSVEDVVGRYQQQLEQRAAQQQQPQQQGMIAGPEGAMTNFSAVRATGRLGLAANAPAAGVGGGAVAAGEQEAGMASLDVELPRRGTVYQFTTPRGEVEIVACSTSLPLIDGLERVGGVAALVAIVLVVRRRLRGRTFSLRAQATFSTVLIVLGVIGAALGVLPVAGLLAVALGVGMKIRLFFARRHGIAAA